MPPAFLAADQPATNYGSETVGTTSEQFLRFLGVEMSKWADIVRSGGMKVE
jgi:hypothetical protein